MALKKREKILAAATGVLLLAFLVVMFFSGGGGSLRQLRARRDQLADDVASKKKKIDSAKKAEVQLAAWQERSLPSSVNDARSLYQAWLRDVVNQVKLGDLTVDTSDGQTRQGIYKTLTFTVHGQGTIDQLTQLLFEFYSVGHLHKIRHLSIKPLQDSDQLALSITIEALCLPGATRADKLSQKPFKRLDLATLEEYRSTVVERKLDDEQSPVSGGLFRAYTPPPPPQVANEEPPESEPPKPPEFDPTTQTYVNAIVEVAGRPQVWLFVRTSGETLKFYQGEKFEIGPVHGTIGKIGPRQVEIEVAGQLCLAALGDNLHDKLPEPPPPPSNEGSKGEATKGADQPSGAATEVAKGTDQPAGTPSAVEKAPDQPAGTPSAVEKAPDQPAGTPGAAEKAPGQPSGTPSSAEKGADQPSETPSAVEKAPDQGPSERVAGSDDGSGEKAAGGDASAAGSPAVLKNGPAEN